MLNKTACLKKHWWKLALAALLLVILAFFIESKYQDRQNVAELEQILTDFKQLEVDVEARTDEEFYITANCSSTDKFSTSYSCILIMNNQLKSLELTKEANAENILLKYKNCRIIDSVDAKEYGGLYCSLNVRSANEAKAEEIFLDYDTSPNSPL